ncbi:hypothetical protein P154DRAFT_520401 [Amniculicola lignicola CBS 123094]|uniref:Uncharacterized protein n=1 Tax=Amniculicola lignicola CBS 123094 TaxID=1392246 RepID=A0A6A5WPS6_9PLEO|nr:hypothetical protein P154DRAFT_520401 [Amniculicola lignicola CBS 123094]
MAVPDLNYAVAASPFPAKTSTASALIKDIETTATAVAFADKILITVTQNGRLAHWLHVPLDISGTDSSLTSNPYLEQDEDTPSSDLLPMHHLTATTVLGGTVAGLDVLGQTLATQVASALLTKNSGEKRMLVLGVGLDKSLSDGREFGDLVGLVLNVI